MKKLLLSALFFVFVIASYAAEGDMVGKVFKVRLTKTDVMSWSYFAKLPSEADDNSGNMGLAGVFSGYVGNDLIIAGGSDFPKGMENRRYGKCYHSDIYVYDEKEGWNVFRNSFPDSLAYGVTISLPEGLLCIGGNNNRECTSEVFLMSLHDGKPVFEDWPSLPHPLSNATGCKVGNKIYLAGGMESLELAASTKDFLVLDLEDKERRWKELPPWPGPSRAYAVSCSQSDGYDNCFYLFSGRSLNGNSPWNVLSDAYYFNPRLGQWKSISGNFNVMAGTAAAFGTNHILLMGGRNSDNADERKIWSYHTVTNTLCAIELPEGLSIPVTTNSFRNAKGETVITCGEDSPGSRTPFLLKGTLQSTIHRLSFTDYSVIALYFLVLIFIGWYFSKKQKTSDDYFRGGGRIPWIIAGLSIFGTALSAITFMAIPAKAYSTDWSYSLFNAGIILVVPVIVLVFIPHYRKLNVTTAYEYLEKRFNAPVRVICSAAFILFQIGRMAVILLLPSIALNVVTGLNIFLCIGAMGVFSLAYTMMGGIEAVAWTDALQVVVLIGAAIAVLSITYAHLPGSLSSIISTTAAEGKFDLGSTAFDLRQPTLWTVLIATVFTNMTTYGTDQTIVQRYMTTSTMKEARKGVYVNAALTIPATVIFFLTGTAIWVFYHYHPAELSLSVQDPDAILPWYISNELPTGVLGLVIAGIFAAAMSTLSSSMNSAATAFVNDIYVKIASKKKDGTGLLRLARIVTLIIGIIGILFAYFMATWEVKSLWDEFSKILGIFLGGLGGLFLLGLVTKKANSFGAICGIIASIAVQIVVLEGGYVNLLLYSTTGFISCFVTGYLASLIVPNKIKNHILL